MTSRQLIALCCLGISTCSCGSETAPETTPPWSVYDLTVRTAPDGYHLRWTATGDDGNTGRAARYDIRYFGGDLAANWGAAQSAASPPKPSNPGHPDSVTVSGIGEGPFEFGIKVADERGNWSGISNRVVASIDTSPPAAITDLNIRSTFQGFYLRWTAPTDNGMTGKANRYEIRYAPSNLAGTWDSSPVATNGVVPASPGHSDSASVLGIGIGPWEFGIKSADPSGNWSAMSNVVTTTIPDDLTPPAGVTDLSVDLVTEQSVVLMWTGSGDDGSTGQAYAYDVRYSESPITSANFYDAIRAQWSGTPQPFGTRQLFTVPNLQTATYYFAIRALDEAENASEISNLVSAETSVPVQLTFQDTTHSLGAPDWSPDGSKIVYTSDMQITTYNNPAIYVIPSSGGTSVRYTSDPKGPQQASWSPDGVKFVLSIFPDMQSGRTVLAVANAQPNAPITVIADPGFPARNVWSGRWSPDGTRIAFIGSTFNPPEPVGSIMYMVAPDGANLQPILGNASWAIAGLDWSPDGTKIVYSSNQDGAYRLWVMPSAGGEATPLVPGASPRWSPDGKKIAYSRDKQLWIVYATGENATQVIFDINKAFYTPAWSPDGKWLAYISWIANIPNLWRVRVSAPQL